MTLLAAFVADPQAAAAAASGAGGRQIVSGQPVSIELFDGEQMSFAPVEVAAHGSAVDDGDPLTPDDVQPIVEWIGERRVDGATVASATFTLLGGGAGGFAAHGSISDGTRSFRISPEGGGVYGLSELDPAFSTGDKADAPAAQPEEAPAGAPIVDDVTGLVEGSGAPLVRNIDVLVAYTSTTPSTRVQEIPQRIAETNTAFANSGGMAQRVTLVATVSVSYTQHSTDMTQDLDRLTLPADGALDNLHGLRDQYGADLVALVVPNQSNACGVGWLPGTTGSPASGFSVSAAFCFDHQVFTHELGHNLGGDHNPEDAGEACNPHAYSCGHRVEAVARDVMSYECPTTGCPRQLQFSNPAVDFVGHPGVRSGIADQRDNARSLTSLAPYVEAYRGQTWSAWIGLGGTLSSGTSAVAVAGGSRLDVFSIAGSSGSHLFQKTFQGSWGSWTDLGQPTGVALSGTPGSVTWQGGRIDVFARGSSGAVWQRTWNATWSGWTNLGGVVGPGATAVSPSANRIDVFVIAGSSGDHLFQRTWSGTWGAWTDLGRPAAAGLTLAPGAVVWQNGRIDVFARGTDGALWQRFWNGTWSGWASLGGTLATGPSAVSVRTNRVDVFAVAGSSADHLFQRSWEGTWGPWSDVGRPSAAGLNAQPGSVAWLNGRADVFPRGTDSALWQRYHTGL